MNLIVCLVLPMYFGAPGMSQLEIAEDSVFAVVTRKAGIAKGLAHNHFIHASEYNAVLEADVGNPESLRFEFSVAVEKLVVDDPTVSLKWFQPIEQMAILEEKLSKLSDKDRRKIRKAMLGKDQLHADKFPEVEARVISIRPKAQKVGNRDFSHELDVALHIHGVRKTKTFAANLGFVQDQLRLEAVAAMKFSDFGIEPYSTLFGAISNQDEFHMYVNLSAEVP